MTEEQANKLLKSAGGQPTGFVKLVKVSQGRYAATHAATETGEVACGTWTRLDAPITEIGTNLATTTCRFCRAELGLQADTDERRRLEALFVLSITLGLRPGELRKLAWDHVDLDNAVIHVLRSASRTGDVKTPKSKRSLVLPQRAVAALQAHKKRQAAERLAAGAAWQDNNLVFCHEGGRMYSSDALNWRFSKMTKRAGIGHWHAYEGRGPSAEHLCTGAACRAAVRPLPASAVDGERLGGSERDTSDPAWRPAGQAAGQSPIPAAGQRDEEVLEANAVNDAAVAAYRLSVQAGNPLSERRLAQMFGRTSRRWARARIADA